MPPCQRASQSSVLGVSSPIRFLPNTTGDGKMGNGSEAPTACTISFLSLFKLASFYARRLLRPCELHPFHSPTSFGPGPPGAELPSADWGRVGRRQLRRLEPLESWKSHRPPTLCPSWCHSSRGDLGGQGEPAQEGPCGREGYCPCGPGRPFRPREGRVCRDWLRWTDWSPGNHPGTTRPRAVGIPR